MKLSRASTYALHAVAHMALQKQTDKAVASHDIAEARGIPTRFLLKVLEPLVGARILTSVRGPHGGYRLAKSASDITVLEIIEAVDGPIRGRVPLSGERNGPLNSKLEGICKQLSEQVRKHLVKVHISDLLGGRK